MSTETDQANFSVEQQAASRKYALVSRFRVLISALDEVKTSGLPAGVTKAQALAWVTELETALAAAKAAVQAM